MQRGCEGWSVSRPAPGELCGLLLAPFEGQSLLSAFAPSQPAPPLIKILKIHQSGSGQKGERKKKQTAVSHHFTLEAKASLES